MDAFSALSVATSVVQFVDFTTKLVAGTREIHASSSGETKRNSELRSITDNLVRLNRGLEKSLDAKKKSQTDAELVPLCKQCNEVAETLIDTLRRLSVNSRRRVWVDFRQALKSVWNQAEIDDLQRRLDSFRQQLSMHLLVTIRDEVTELGRQRQDNAYRSLDDTQRKTEVVLQNLETTDEFKEDIVRLIHNETTEELPRTENARFIETMKQYLPESEIRKLNWQLIHQLGYKEKSTRFDEVATAHQRTFAWLFHSQSRGDRTWSNFPAWLREEDNNMYWITGKPGSGKSTLMKYLWAHEATEQALYEWVGDSPVAKASFFFWNSGTRIQMAQDGLLRKLLYDLLQEYPHMASSLFPHRLEERILFREDAERPQPWRWNELLKAFKTLIAQLTKTSKVFLVIDGLDEFDGDPKTIIAFVESLLLPNVKICASSRPWVAFEDSFHHRPSLRLEDLTEDDIRIYVNSKLDANPGYHTLERFDPTYAKRLVENVTMKASGVFLWVYLVVQSLEEGLTEGERLSDLQRRLDSLPEDLENLFQKMLNSLGPVKFQRAARLLRLVRAAIVPITLVNLSYADEDDVEYIFTHETKPVDPSELLPRAELMRRRLNACCKGLIEPKSKSSQADIHSPVGYLHRTVKDFLELHKRWDEITVEHFNPNLHLCVSHLAMLKTDATSNSNEETLWSLITFVVEYLSRSEMETSPLYVSLLDELDRTADTISKSSRSTEFRQGIGSQQHWIMLSPQFRKTWDANFRHFAVRCQIIPYVKACLEERRSTIRNSEMSSLLWSATVHYSVWAQQYLHDDFRLQKPSVSHREPNLEVIEMLLKHGANPNAILDKQTIWQHVLNHSYLHSKTKCAVMALFLQYGANPRDNLVGLRIPDESNKKSEKSHQAEKKEHQSQALLANDRESLNELNQFKHSIECAWISRIASCWTSGLAIRQVDGPLDQ